MTAWLIINAILGFAMLAVSCWSATGNALDFYSNTLYIMLHSALAGGMAVAGVYARKGKLVFLVLSSLALATLWVSGWYGLQDWPGGDDGGAFGWMFFVLGGCVISFVVAMVSLVGGIASAAFRKAPPTQATETDDT